MVDIFREVDEDVRRDRLTALWRRWRWHAGGGAAALVVGVAAVVGWRAHVEAAALDRGARFTEAMRLAEEGSYDASARAFGQFADGEDGAYAALARLRQAAMLVQAGDRPGAIAAYNRLIDSGADPLYTELAQVLASQHLIDAGETRAAEGRLRPIADGAGPWRFLAREMLAAAALQDGRLTEARREFAALRDEAGAPDGARARAESLAAALGAPAPDGGG